MTPTLAGRLPFRTPDPARLADSAGAASARTLLTMMEAHDPATAAHMDRVGELAGQIGCRLGLEPQLLIWLELGGRLHDIGKLAISPAVLRSSAALPPLEQHRMRRCPVIGEQLVRMLPLAPAVARIVRQHAERLDGSGQPDGLRGAEIDLPARVVAVADAFDAMTSPRPYRLLLSPDAALARLVSEAGSLWDAEVVAALVAYLNTEPSFGRAMEAERAA